MEKKRAKKKLCLEDYMEFLSSHKQLPLNVNSLKQIISIHGFKKLYKVKKELIGDAVETLDLIDPSRSTLKSSSSSAGASALLTQDEIIGDLKRLDWKECCVTSIQAVSLNSPSSTPTPTQQSLPKSKPKAKAKSKGSVDSLYSASAILSSAPTPTQRSLPKSESKVKSKRSVDSLFSDSAILSSAPTPTQQSLPKSKAKSKRKRSDDSLCSASAIVSST